MDESIRHGLGNLMVFRGRDSRARFWPYAGCVLGAGFVLGNGLFLAVMVGGAAQGMSFETVISLLFVVTGLSAVVLILFLGAAVARRLHDRDVRGWWAFVPVLLMASSFGLMLRLPLVPEPDAGLGLFLVIFAINAVYLASVAALLVVLVLPSRPEPNRFDQ